MSEKVKSGEVDSLLFGENKDPRLSVHLITRLAFHTVYHDMT